MDVQPHETAPAADTETAAWLSGIAATRSDTDRDLVGRALYLARVAHAGQSRASGDPYITHPMAVAKILDGLGLDAETIAAAILHDVVEDTDVDLPRVQREFGDSVAKLVDGVTRMHAIDRYGAGEGPAGASRRRVEQLRKLLIAMVQDVRVVLIKLADRLHNVRTLRALPEDRRLRVARETIDVYAPLASRLGIWQFKWELEDLSFRVLEPETYLDIARRLDERRADRERWIARVVSELDRELREHEVVARIHGRPKHIYGIWKKMRSKGVDFDQIFDARAVRVLVDDVADCYTALGVVHALWHHVPREFDDYITNPKPNRYQSLHTAVIGPGGRTLEVQIRTHEMHAHAEYGIAAHWRYKEGGTRGERDMEAKIAWLRRVLEWKEEGDGGDDLMGRLQGELLDERVYVVTPRGEIVDLPTGATPLDFAYQLHTEVGHRCRGARVNGTMVPLTHALHSGDRVEILTSGRTAPSRDWLSPHLGYLRTARARAKVRQWFKQQDYDRNLADGHAVYERELKRLGVAGVDRERLRTRFNFTRFEDLIAAIGRGDVSTGQLAGALQQELPAPPPKLPPQGAARERLPRGGIEVRGVGDLLTSMARCCHPVPPDPIAGYITRGRGVTVHRADCGNILRLSDADRARLVDVSWSDTGQSSYPVDVVVTAYDRPGLIRDVTTAVAVEKVNISRMDTDTDPEENMVTIRMRVDVADLQQLSRMLDRIGQAPNVLEARRTS